MIIFARMINGYILNKQDRMVLETIRRTIRSGMVSITIPMSALSFSKMPYPI